MKAHKLICYNPDIFDPLFVDGHIDETNYPYPTDLQNNVEHYQQLANNCPMSNNEIRNAICKKHAAMNRSYFDCLAKLNIHPEVQPYCVCKLYSKKNICSSEVVLVPPSQYPSTNTQQYPYKRSCCK